MGFGVLYICVNPVLLIKKILTFLLVQDFQRDIVKAAEAFTAVGYKHIEAGKE